MDGDSRAGSEAAAPPTTGTDRWRVIANRLPELLDELSGRPALTRDDIARAPATPGVYLFSEGSRPVYVGQTRNLRRRLVQHAAGWARENQATFAFNRARALAALDPAFDLRRTRKAMAVDAVFAQLFARERERVATMSVRCVEVRDAELRTVFEVYASVVLGTENNFETH